MLWHIFKIIYLLIWLLLLVHCLKRRQFFPIIKSGWSTKILWLFTFVFLNPLLTFLYTIFGVLLKPLSADRKQPLARIASIIALILIAATLIFFEMPALGIKSGPVTIAKDADSTNPKKSVLFLEANAGVLKSQNNFSTTTSSSNSPNDRFASNSVIIRCQSDHPLMDRTARLLQEELAKRPGINHITYYPSDQATPVDQVLPDIFITLDMPRIKENKSPIGRKIDASITCNAGTSLNTGSSYTSYSNSPPHIHFSYNSTLHHKSDFNGIETRQAKYTQQAADIAEQISQSLNKQFDQWTEKHGQMPQLPDFLYGYESDPPQFPFQNSEFAHKIMSGNGLFLNNHSTWMFKDDRPIKEVLTDCRDQLIKQGFRGGEGLDKETKYPVEHITMSKDDIHIAIFRQRKRNLETGRMVLVEKNNQDKTQDQPMPMVVHYKSLFTRDQITEAMEKLLDSDVELETLLIFQEHFRSDDHKQRLFEKLEETSSNSMAGYIVIARLYKESDNKEKAKDALMLARVMARAEKIHNPKRNEIKRLAKDLEDESLAKKDIPLGYFTKAGFVDLAAITEPVSIEISPGQTAKFCIVVNDNEVKTITLLITRLHAHEKQIQPQYELIKIIKTENSSSVGTGSFLSGFTANVEGYERIQIKIKPLENQKFKIIAPPAKKLPTK